MAAGRGSGARLRVLALIAAAGTILGLAAFWLLTLPAVVPAATLPPYTANLDNGRTMFNIGGCASCHAVPNPNPVKVDRTRLGGGLALKSPFGTFYVPNISPDPKDGIGSWSEANFVTAMWKGTSEHGNNLYPAFPYTSYQHMQLKDVRDLFAKSAQFNRGAYLVNGPGHCAECHSPRNALGGIIEDKRFAGGPAADGHGWVPNITQLGLRQGDTVWSEKDIASFLNDGMDPSGDFAGGAMADVIRNTSLLGADDRSAIAAYVAALPPVQGPTPPPKK
jgi:mono/diheme cytochrome c family protein